VGVALVHAQAFVENSQEIDLTDPAFIEEHVSAVLDPKARALSNIDLSGQLLDKTYRLKLFGNEDLSRFLVMAEAKPSLLQSLIPKKHIVLDSNFMELRAVSKIGPWRKLLKKKSFDTVDPVALYDLASKGTRIGLKELDEESPGSGFLPPA